MRNLLVADDDANIRELLRYVMTREGFGIYEAQDGLKAIELMKQTPIDLAIVDVMMPRMDGLELCDYIRQNYDIPISFLGSNMYYHVKLKPYNDEKLIGIAEQMKQYAEKQPDDIDRYLQNAAALGYQLFLTDGQGSNTFYGREFREHDLDDHVKELVLGGHLYHGVADFPNKPFISGFFDNRMSNTVPARFSK